MYTLLDWGAPLPAEFTAYTSTPYSTKGPAKEKGIVVLCCLVVFAHAFIESLSLIEQHWDFHRQLTK